MKSALKLNSIPMKNMRTHPVRTMILMLLVIAQAACVMGGLMLTRSMRQEMALAEARLGADILVYPSAAMSKISSKTLLMQGSPVEVWKDRSILSRILLLFLPLARSFACCGRLRAFQIQSVEDD